MQTVAPAGGIVISEDTRHLVEGYFDLHELGPTEVKGLEGPINVYEVIGAGPFHGHFDLAVRRGLTKFVGRESELKQMAHALELARGGGHGQIVAVVAEAGTGKSRSAEHDRTFLFQRSTIARFCFSGARSPFVSADHDRTFFSLDEVINKALKRALIRAPHEAHGNCHRAAQLLGVSRYTVPDDRAGRACDASRPPKWPRRPRLGKGR